MTTTQTTDNRQPATVQHGPTGLLGCRHILIDGKPVGLLLVSETHTGWRVRFDNDLNLDLGWFTTCDRAFAAARAFICGGAK